jgi:hypothetical protein
LNGRAAGNFSRPLGGIAQNGRKRLFARDVGLANADDLTSCGEHTRRDFVD